MIRKVCTADPVVGPGLRRAKELPSEATLAAFGAASSSQVADAMSRMGAMDAGIRALWASPRVIGAAVTAWCHAGVRRG